MLHLSATPAARPFALTAACTHLQVDIINRFLLEETDDEEQGSGQPAKGMFMEWLEGVTRQAMLLKRQFVPSGCIDNTILCSLFFAIMRVVSSRMEADSSSLPAEDTNRGEPLFYSFIPHVRPRQFLNSTCPIPHLLGCFC